MDFVVKIRVRYTMKLTGKTESMWASKKISADSPETAKKKFEKILKGLKLDDLKYKVDEITIR